MARGVPLTPEQVERAAQVYGETGNMLETSRRIGIPESTLRTALKRAGIAKRRELHARAVEAGIRKARKGLTKSLDLVEKLLSDENKDGPGIEPKEIAMLLNARARATDSLLQVAQNADRRKQAKLTRDKTRAEIALIQAKARGDVVDATVIAVDDKQLDELMRSKFGVKRQGVKALLDDGSKPTTEVAS